MTKLFSDPIDIKNIESLVEEHARITATSFVDPVGGASSSHEIPSTRLPRALRNSGVMVPADRPGPFRATRDGNQMVSGFGYELQLAENDRIVNGRYVVWLGLSNQCGHFIAVEKNATHWTVHDGESSRVVQTQTDVTGDSCSLWLKVS